MLPVLQSHYRLGRSILLILKLNSTIYRPSDRKSFQINFVEM